LPTLRPVGSEPAAPSPERRGRDRRIAWSAACLAIVVAVLLAGALWPDAIARALRKGLEQATLGHLLILAAGITAVALVIRALPGTRPDRARHGEERTAGGHADVAPWAAGVLAVSAVAGVVWYSLDRARVLPRTFADELLHEQVARGIAQSGDLSTHGYGLVSGLIDAVPFWVTSDGASVFHGIQLLNVIVMVSAALPAYVLARRVVTRPSALVVAGLTVLVPWMAYSQMITTEAAFYPVFLLFVLALVRALEEPSLSRQLVLAAALVVAFETRTQAVALAGAILLAVVIQGLSRGRTRAVLRAFAPTWIAYGAVAVVVVVAAAAGIFNPLGAYQQLLDTGLGALHPHGLLLWTAANVTSISLGAGVLAALAFPLGVAQLLRRGSSTREAAFASAAVAVILAILVTVVVLCESRYGSGTVGERNLFYIVPLLFIGAAAWVERGFPRPRLLTAIVLAVAVALAALMAPGSIGVVVDSRTFGLWTELNRSWFPEKWQMVAAIAIGAVIVWRLRRGWPIALAALLTAIGVTAANDRPATQPRSVAERYGWLDRSLPAGATATLLYIGFPGGVHCAVAPRVGDEGNLLLYTQIFDLKARSAFQALGQNPASGVAAPGATIARSGLVSVNGRPLRAEYIALDSGVAVVGRRIAELRARDVISGSSSGAAVALWKVDGAVRLRRPADVFTTARLRRLGCTKS
jgi:hypothetical protein